MTEKKIIEVMVRLYCRKNHKTAGRLCPECEKLLLYSWKRLASCPYRENKTTCAKCNTHCYKPEMREKIRAVMRFSGPRMLIRHPSIVLGHLIKI